METRDTKMVIVVRRDINMRKGKIAAQAAHAAMKFLIDHNEAERNDELYVKLSPVEIDWMFNGAFAKIVCSVDNEDELNQLVLKAQLADIEVHTIIDAGRTEFNGVPTLTCAAFGPDDVEVLDKVTGHLKLM